jgi:hypothetical protein
MRASTERKHETGHARPRPVDRHQEGERPCRAGFPERARFRKQQRCPNTQGRSARGPLRFRGQEGLLTRQDQQRLETVAHTANVTDDRALFI